MVLLEYVGKWSKFIDSVKFTNILCSMYYTYSVYKAHLAMQQQHPKTGNMKKKKSLKQPPAPGVRCKMNPFQMRICNVKYKGYCYYLVNCQS